MRPRPDTVRGPVWPAAAERGAGSILRRLYPPGPHSGPVSGRPARPISRKDCFAPRAGPCENTTCSDPRRGPAGNAVMGMRTRLTTRLAVRIGSIPFLLLVIGALGAAAPAGDDA